MVADGVTDVQSGEFRTFRVRKAHEDKLDGIIAVWTAKHDRHDLMRRLQAVGVPSGVVNDTRDLFQDEQLRHREHFTWLDHPEMGPYATDYTESHLSATPGTFGPAGSAAGSGHRVRVAGDRRVERGGLPGVGGGRGVGVNTNPG